MRILVDADACPVKEIIVEIAKKNNIEVLMFFDVSHVYDDGYSKVIYCSKGFDSVDYVLLNEACNDIVVTQDYGLASMCLMKAKYVINQNGLIYSNDNINTLLDTRYISQKMRKSSKHVKGPRKRTFEQDENFKRVLEKIISSLGVDF